MSIAINTNVILVGMILMAGTSAKLSLYSTPQPNPGDTPTGTLLGVVTMGSTLGTTSSDTTYWLLTLTDTTPDDDANASGTAVWARLTDISGDIWIADMNVGETGSGAAIIMDSTTIYQHGTISIISGIIKVAK